MTKPIEVGEAGKDSELTKASQIFLGVALTTGGHSQEVRTFRFNAGDGKNVGSVHWEVEECSHSQGPS